MAFLDLQTTHATYLPQQMCYPATVPRTLCALDSVLTASTGDFSVVPIGARVPLQAVCSWLIGKLPPD
jgi:hypothetical protein